ncbi:hypothetical protein [Pseudothauera rhizosphaerae]|uniref:Uncharacterized protein n=1 Tax=Pseudothauera rhizosphaerae TaxID=2565932 RepID=A0A4S4AY91_9RHOO|nr:hypothetical protein [Pseudothauera rhizosphaerae]THF65106.1 hypothetical protein E6O51_00415 [Pseudothauera rhizosphaerae]
MSAAAKPAIRRDWWSKTLAGALLGLSLAFACSGLLALALAGLPMGIRGQLAMWSLPPVWLGVLSGVYFFHSGLRAWAWLGAANGLAFGLLAVFRLS